MGLIRCFTAAQMLRYDTRFDYSVLGSMPENRRFFDDPEERDAGGLPREPPAVFNLDLVAGDHGAIEELDALRPDLTGRTYRRPACLWGSSGTAAQAAFAGADASAGMPVINVYGLCRWIYTDNPVNDVAWWVIDALSGQLAFEASGSPVTLHTRIPVTDQEFNPLGGVYMNPIHPRVVLVGGDSGSGTSVIVHEPFNDGALWRFGPYEDSNHGGVMEFSAYSYGRLAGVDQVSGPLELLLWSDYGLVANTADFAIDRRSDRVFVRLAASEGWDVGRVAIYKHSDHSFVANIWAANETNGIIPNGDGTVFVVDKLGWICWYTYDGQRLGAARNARPTQPGGVAYGWDPVYKRLLMLEGTASGASGESTLQVKGFLPLAAADYLTKAIPRTPPRKNRQTDFVAHVCDAGGMPVASRITTRAIFLDTAVTDAQGDAVHTATPLTTDPIEVDLFVQTTTILLPVMEGLALPNPAIGVASTDGYSAAGTLLVKTDTPNTGRTDGFQVVTYTSKNDTYFEGCTGGVGVMHAGNQVTQ